MRRTSRRQQDPVSRQSAVAVDRQVQGKAIVIEPLARCNVPCRRAGADSAIGRVDNLDDNVKWLAYRVRQKPRYCEDNDGMYTPSAMKVGGD